MVREQREPFVGGIAFCGAHDRGLRVRVPVLPRREREVTADIEYGLELSGADRQAIEAALVDFLGRNQDDPGIECAALGRFTCPRALERIAIRAAQPTEGQEHFQDIGQLLNPSFVVGRGQVLGCLLLQFRVQERGQLNALGHADLVGDPSLRQECRDAIANKLAVVRLHCPETSREAGVPGPSCIVDRHTTDSTTIAASHSVLAHV
jgi:hypothetical protein